MGVWIIHGSYRSGLAASAVPGVGAIIIPITADGNLGTSNYGRARELLFVFVNNQPTVS